MKTLSAITTLAFLAINSMAVARPFLPPPPPKDTRVLAFDLLAEGSKVSPKHVTNFQGGTAEINYAANTVTLRLASAPKCQEGMLCAQMLQLKVIELPIVDISSDNECSVTVMGKKDSRPVDGILEQIKIEDYSTTNCRFFVKPISNVEYLTSFVNRQNGKNITTISTIKADLVDATPIPEASEYYALTSGEYIKGFRKNEEVETGSIIISEDSVHLEIYNKSNCPMGAMCLVGPTVIIGDFQIESREMKNCAEIITAVDNTPGVGRKLKISNYLKGNCDMRPANGPVLVDYYSQVVAPKAPKQQARFYFDYHYVPFVK